MLYLKRVREHSICPFRRFDVYNPYNFSRPFVKFVNVIAKQNQIQKTQAIRKSWRNQLRTQLHLTADDTLKT